MATQVTAPEVEVVAPAPAPTPTPEVDHQQTASPHDSLNADQK